MIIKCIPNDVSRQAMSRRAIFTLAAASCFGLVLPAEAATGRHPIRHPRHGSGDVGHHRRDEPTGGASEPHGETVGMASFYGAGDSSHTASGERFNPHALTAAHRTLPLGTSVRVTNLSNGRQVVVRINDRGPFSHGRLIDLSRSAAEALDFISRGVTKVRIEAV